MSDYKILLVTWKSLSQYSKGSLDFKLEQKHIDASIAYRITNVLINVYINAGYTVVLKDPEKTKLPSVVYIFKEEHPTRILKAIESDIKENFKDDRKLKEEMMKEIFNHLEMINNKLDTETKKLIEELNKRISEFEIYNKKTFNYLTEIFDKILEIDLEESDGFYIIRPTDKEKINFTMEYNRKEKEYYFNLPDEESSDFITIRNPIAFKKTISEASSIKVTLCEVLDSEIKTFKYSSD